MKYEVTRDVDMSVGYVTLVGRQSGWPEDQRNRPQPWNIRLLEQFPFTDGVYSWWPIVQVIPRKKTRLAGILEVAYVAYFMV